MYIFVLIGSPEFFLAIVGAIVNIQKKRGQSRRLVSIHLYNNKIV